LKGQSKELSVQSERQRAIVHVEEHPQDALFLEWLAVLATFSVAPMSQLPKAIEGKAKIVVTESIRYAELLLSGDPNFELVLSSCVSYNFPVVLTVHERSIRNHCPEKIICLIEECMPIVAREGYFLR